MSETLWKVDELIRLLRRDADDESICGFDIERTTSCHAGPKLDDAADHLENQKARIEQLEAESERLRGLLSVAVCPDKDCDNHGTIAVQELVGYNEHGEAETDVDLQQCQWCDMRMELTKEGTDETT